MIVKRKNKYGARIYQSGRQVWVGTYRTRREALAAERAALDSRASTRDETCDSFARRWVADYPRPRSSTDRHNGYAVEKFGVEFAGQKLSSIERSEVRPWALRNQWRVPALRAMFKDALDDGFVTSNPFANLGIEGSRGRRDIDVISEETLMRLADTALQVCDEMGPTLRAMILFSAYVGLRPAEMFVLRWSDVDFTSGRVHIRQSLTSTGEVTLPKNGRARTVVLPPPAADALRTLPRRLDSPLVFVTSRGTGWKKTTHFHRWNLIRLAAGLRGMDYYELRHFCATHLLELGLRPSDVAIQLGHNDGGILVMKTYGHPEEEAARQRIARAFLPKGQLTPLDGGAHHSVPGPDDSEEDPPAVGAVLPRR